ncbi:MAG TPA: SRPBCC family protein [Acidimicrobiales bacterium]|nr:SRPBCC family protein [Acidimicrobiales bacterium]
MGESVVSVERVINAPASSIFAIVSDPSRHAEIDGSGSVVRLKTNAPPHLALGSTFGMSMKLGVPYSMSNEVIALEPDKQIAWQTTLSGPLGRFIGGRIWRYELEPADGGTLVRETWDIRQDKQRFMLRAGPVGKQTASAMSRTLEALAKLTESPPASPPASPPPPAPEDPGAP